MFRYRCQLRRWSLQVLVLWFFGIASSFAHACLSGQATDSRVQTAAASMAAHAGGVQPDSTPSEALEPSPAVEPHCGTGSAPGALKTHCQDFCDKSTISIPPLKLALDHADASAALVPVGHVCPAPVSEPQHRRLPRRDGALAPPCTIAIAFLRLAL